MDLEIQTPNGISFHYTSQYRIQARNLSYKLPTTNDQINLYSRKEASDVIGRYILKNINCEAVPGKITAIAGPSGAGKTTLLKILSGDIVPRRVSGQLLVNDQPMNVKNYRRVSGYVAQDEALFQLLTVEETLMYSARLRVCGGREKASARVKKLLKELELEHVAAVRIGDESSTRGISSGERRRVSIGVSLVHDPSILLIDEPTSGLDSASALHVMLLLKSMAKDQGKTVVITIHQPGFRILELLNIVILLSNGVVLHHGPLNLLEVRLKSTGHFIPERVNVLEYAIDVIPSLEEEEQDFERLEKEQEYDQDTKRVVLRNIVDKHIMYSNSRFHEVLILSRRFSSIIFRTKQLFAARIIRALIGGILLGTIFMNAKHYKKSRPQILIGFFASTLAFLLSSTAEGLPIFLNERRIIVRETCRGAYRISSYIIANTLVFLPFLLTVALLYATPAFWLVGLTHDLEGYLYFSLVVWLVVVMSNSFVLCFSALVPDFIMGTPLISGVMGLFFLFSGFFVSKNDLPKQWIFMHYFSLFKYPYECFLINEFGGEKGKEICVKETLGICLLHGDEFLKLQGLKDTEKWTNLAIMLAFIFGYRFLCFLILWYKSYRSRN